MGNVHCFACNCCKWHILRMWENITSDIGVHQRLKSACTSVQYDQSLRCLIEGTSCPWLSKMRPVKIMIRLREYTGLSESSLGTCVQKYAFWRCGSFICLSMIALKPVVCAHFKQIDNSSMGWHSGPIYGASATHTTDTLFSALGGLCSRTVASL